MNPEFAVAGHSARPALGRPDLVAGVVTSWLILQVFLHMVFLLLNAVIDEMDGGSADVGELVGLVLWHGTLFWLPAGAIGALAAVYLERVVARGGGGQGLGYALALYAGLGIVVGLLYMLVVPVPYLVVLAVICAVGGRIGAEIWHRRRLRRLRA